MKRKPTMMDAMPEPSRAYKREHGRKFKKSTFENMGKWIFFQDNNSPFNGGLVGPDYYGSDPWLSPLHS